MLGILFLVALVAFVFFHHRFMPSMLYPLCLIVMPAVGFIAGVLVERAAILGN